MATPEKSSSPDSLRQLITQINDFLSHKNCPQALPLLVQLSAHYPPQSQAYAQNALALGQCLLITRQAAQALAYFQQAQAINPQLPELDDWLRRAQREAQEEEEMGVLESPHFLLQVEPQIHTWDSAKVLLQELETAFDLMSDAWKMYPQYQIYAVLFDSSRFADLPLPDWTGALFDGKVRIPVNIFNLPDKGQQLIRHEVAHAFIHELTNHMNLDTWLNEGLAQMLDGTKLDTALLLQTQNIPALEALQGNFLAHTDAQEAHKLYAVSQAMTQRLFTEHLHANMEKMRSILQGIGQGVPLDEVLQGRLNITSADLHSWVQNQYSSDSLAQQDTLNSTDPI